MFPTAGNNFTNECQSAAGKISNSLWECQLQPEKYFLASSILVKWKTWSLFLCSTQATLGPGKGNGDKEGDFKSPTASPVVSLASSQLPGHPESCVNFHSPASGFGFLPPLRKAAKLWKIVWAALVNRKEGGLVQEQTSIAFDPSTSQITAERSTLKIQTCQRYKLGKFSHLVQGTWKNSHQLVASPNYPSL